MISTDILEMESYSGSEIRRWEQEEGVSDMREIFRVVELLCV
jgi:hypothetical protein